MHRFSSISMCNAICAASSVLAFLTSSPAQSQQLTLDTSFGNAGSLTLDAGSDWNAAWNDRNARIAEIDSTRWVLGGSFSRFVSPDLFYMRRYSVFNADAVGALSTIGWGVGPPLTTGGILYYSDDNSIGFVGTGNPGGAATTTVHQARSFVDSGSIYGGCAGSFQASNNFGPSALDDVRGAARGWFVRGTHTTVAVGSTRLSNGESRGLIAQFRADCVPDAGFGSGGAVLLDVNPFVIGAPPRAIRINSVARYLNASGDPRLVVAGGVRYGLGTGDPGACFIAMLTTEGVLDGAFDFDGIRIYDPPVQGGGNIACDFNTLALTFQPGDTIGTVADWKRVGGGTAVYAAAPVRFNANGSLFADWSNHYNVGSVTERGPSTLAIRSDQNWVFGSSLLSGISAGGQPLSSTELRLIHPGTGLGSSAVAVPWDFSDGSKQISAILPLPNNRIFVIGTSGDGRFGHRRLHVARFSDGRLALNVTVSGNGGGDIGSAPAGIACNRFGGDCEEYFTPGTTVTLTAMPGVGSLFTGWSGAASTCNSNLTCTLTIDAITAVGASFAPLITVAVTRIGIGSVQSLPLGIDCGSFCSAEFAQGSVVRLTATPSLGHVFSGWSNAAAVCGSNPVCDLNVTAAFTATATFSPAMQTMAIHRIGTGLVFSTPAGIDCGTTCTASFATGSTITLEAAAILGSGFEFDTWSGDAAVCASNPVCALSVNSTLDITVTFRRQQLPLTVSLGGNGLGIVSSDPAGIDCGAVCTFAFPAASSVTLNATANAGSVFSGWAGDLSICGNNPQCTISLHFAANGTANFSVASESVFTSGFE